MEKLYRLYSEIQKCHICNSFNDNEKFLRKVEAVDNQTDTFIISQALSKDNVRITGVNFFNLQGKVGRTGIVLEKFLSKFDRTIYPPISIKLQNNVIIPKREQGKISVYNSEIIHCFPGRNVIGKGDKVPMEAINNCINNNFLLKEILFIKPRLIILHGDISRRNFYKFILNDKCPSKLSNHIKEILDNNCLPSHSIENHHFNVLPMMHATSFGRAIWEFMENEKILQLVKKILA